MSKRIHSFDQLIEILGGTGKVAEWAGIKESGVSNWRERGIPPGFHLRLFVEIKKRRLVVDPNLFGLTREEVRILMRADEAMKL